MKKVNIRRLVYHVRHHYLTTQNGVVIVAFIIAASWAWGSIGVMQRNYDLQRELDAKYRERQLAALQVQTLEFEQRYYQTREYQELAVRDRLNLADPGEKVLILPPNSTPPDEVSSEGAPVASQVAPPSHIQQWVNFLFGGNARGLRR